MSSSKEVFRGVTGADLAALGLVVAVCSPWLAVIALGRWEDVTAWCAEHDVLVAADQDPPVKLPGTDGLGLDTPRLLILVVAVLAVLAAIWYLRYRWRIYRMARYERRRARYEWRRG